MNVTFSRRRYVGLFLPVCDGAPSCRRHPCKMPALLQGLQAAAMIGSNEINCLKAGVMCSCSTVGLLKACCSVLIIIIYLRRLSEMQTTKLFPVVQAQRDEYMNA